MEHCDRCMGIVKCCLPFTNCCALLGVWLRQILLSCLFTMQMQAESVVLQTAAQQRHEAVERVLKELQRLEASGHVTSVAR